MSLGRVIDSSQKCHTKHTLPTSYRGSSTARRNAKRSSPPAKFFGPEETHRNATVPAPKGKGQDIFAEMPCNKRPFQPVTGGHCGIAVMPPASRPHLIWATRATQKMSKACRPITRGQAMLAEMPFCRRLATKKEVKYG